MLSFPCKYCSEPVECAYFWQNKKVACFACKKKVRKAYYEKHHNKPKEVEIVKPAS